MNFIYIITFSIFASLVLNIFVVKIIGFVDYELLGLQHRNSSLINIYKSIVKDRRMNLKIIFFGVISVIFNCIILSKMTNEFGFILLKNYFRYYYIFLILYVFAFIDYVTYYVYTILSYPSIVFSIFLFILSFVRENGVKDNLETLYMIFLFYLIIKKFKLLGEGDFYIVLIVSLTLGVLPTVFIFYLSVVMLGIIGIFILVKRSFKVKYSKIPFVPFIFFVAFLFIIINV